MGENNLTVADALALRNSGDDGIFGGSSGAWWLIILIFLFMGGWNNGWGGNGGSNPCCTPATAQGMTDAFNFSSLSGSVQTTHDAVVDGFYQNNLATTTLGTALQTSFGQAALQNAQGFNGVQNAVNAGTNAIQAGLCAGFNGVQAAIADSNYRSQNCCCETRQAIMQSNFNNQAGFNSVVNSIASNACDISRGQDDIKYLMAQNQSQTLVGIDRLGDRIIDYMNQSKMDELRTELQNARFQISQAAQTEQLLGALQPISKPAYITASPYQSLGYNAANGCGCGNF